MLVWRKGNINKNCLSVTVLCTIIMVHKDTSISYRSVDCIGLWSCLFLLSVFKAPLCLRFSWCYIDIFFCLNPSLYFLLIWASRIGPSPGWLTIVLQCYAVVGFVIWPVKSSPKWSVSSGTLNSTIPYICCYLYLMKISKRKYQKKIEKKNNKWQIKTDWTPVKQMINSCRIF